jgi:hypothetical protein
LSRDTATLSDVWYDGEHRRLLELVALWGPAWRQIGTVSSLIIIAAAVGVMWCDVPMRVYIKV